MLDNKIIVKMFYMACEILGYGQWIPLKIVKRRTCTRGRISMLSDTEAVTKITLNKQYCQTGEQLLRTVAHELAHIKVWNHGAEHELQTLRYYSMIRDLRALAPEDWRDGIVTRDVDGDYLVDGVDRDYE
jgi:hypothetical protein